MRVDDIADSRAGDKGDTLILAVLPRSDEAWPILVQHLTPGLVASHFGYPDVAPPDTCPVTRREVASLPGLVFRLPGMLGRGVTDGRRLDGHGKTLSYHLLNLELPFP